MEWASLVRLRKLITYFTDYLVHYLVHYNSKTIGTIELNDGIFKISIQEYAYLKKKDLKINANINRLQPIPNSQYPNPEHLNFSYLEQFHTASCSPRAARSCFDFLGSLRRWTPCTFGAPHRNTTSWNNPCTDHSSSPACKPLKLKINYINTSFQSRSE